ncbi:MAG: type II toxin-antitoxin system PemK/MazF family toxin [Anaerolineae bacterium]|nr:type II toxin-antitoxin system PemK/MazF family toxin [Anaerolineae bacterium]
MTTYRRGDIVLIRFPFTSGAEEKKRPALVLADTGDDDSVAARVTSQPGDTAYDVTVTDWQQAGLLLPSVVRVHKLATLEKGRIARRLGTLTDRDWQQVREAVLHLWRAL